MLSINSQFFGGRGSGGGKGSGKGNRRAGNGSLSSMSYEDAEVRVHDVLSGKGVPEEMARDMAMAIARDRADSFGDDSSTSFKSYTPSQRQSIQNAYVEAVQSLGYSEGTLNIRKVKVSGNRSMLKNGGSTGATYETRYSFTYSK